MKFILALGVLALTTQAFKIFGRKDVEEISVETAIEELKIN